VFVKLGFRPATTISLGALVVFDLMMSDVVSGTKSLRAQLLALFVVPISVLIFLLY
jgi:hypothetical protein